MYRLNVDKQLTPSSWLSSHAGKIKAGGKVLDLAAGSGRNAKWLASQGYQVEAVDINETALAELQGIQTIHTTVSDIENTEWLYGEEEFDAILVCRYLHRPLFPKIKQSLKAGGVLIYETFMLGQEQYGRPSNPNFLLEPGELQRICKAGYLVEAFEEGLLEIAPPAMLQRICAIKC